MHTNNIFKRIIFIFVVFQFSINFIYSQETEKKVDNKKENVVEEKNTQYTPLRKLTRGVANTTLCWVEVPRQAIKDSKKDKLYLTPLKGLTYTVGRFCIGVYEMVTFFAPPYKPIVNPEFVFSEEEKED